MSPSTLYEWRKRIAPDGSKPRGSSSDPEDLEKMKLRREVRRLQQEVEILKKATAFFAKEQL